MRTAKLMRGKPPPDARLDRRPVYLELAALADQAYPRVGPAITQNNGPTGSVARSASHACSDDQPHASIPT